MFAIKKLNIKQGCETDQKSLYQFHSIDTKILKNEIRKRRSRTA